MKHQCASNHRPAPVPGAMLLLTVGVAASLGCGPDTSYELRWTLGCESQLGPCEVDGTRDCASVGIDAIEVTARRGTSGKRSVYACFSASEGPSGRGPGLKAGEYELTIYPLSPAGRRLLEDPVIAEATVPDDGFGSVEVDIPVPPACSDGVDNDADGQVDLFDTDCPDAQGLSEAPG